MPAENTTAERVFGAYVEAALWSSTDQADETGGQPLDADYTADDLAAEAAYAMRADCERFIARCGADLDTLDPEQAGHDFWLTRNGHGAGFWDRGLGEVGDRLTAVAQSYGEANIIIVADQLHYAAPEREVSR